MNKVARQLEDLEMLDSSAQCRDNRHRDRPSRLQDTYNNAPVSSVDIVEQPIANSVKNRVPSTSEYPSVKPQPLQTEVQHFRDLGSQWPYPGPTLSQPAHRLADSHTSYEARTISDPRVAQCNITSHPIPYYQQPSGSMPTKTIIQHRQDKPHAVHPIVGSKVMVPNMVCATNRNTDYQPPKTQAPQRRQFQEMAKYTQGQPLFRKNFPNGNGYNPEPQSFLWGGRKTRDWT